MAIVTVADVERATQKDFDGNSKPTDDDVTTFIDECQDFMEGLIDFAIEEVTETDILIDVEIPTDTLIIKYPITTFTKLEERQHDTYVELTTGPINDFTVDKANGMIKATSSFSPFEPGPEMYRLNYKHGLLSTDRKYKTAQMCLIKLINIAILNAEQGANGHETIASFGVGGLSVGFKGDEKMDKLLQEAIRMIKVIRGEWRPFGNEV